MRRGLSRGALARFRPAKLAALAVALLTVGPVPSPAYYHFIHYLKSGNAPEKFDLSALPNKTVTFFVSESGPTTYSQNDTFNSVLSQIQQATLVWNGVASSDLRVSFGGLENVATPQNTPGGDVLFEDLPPGVEGFGGPTTLASPATAANGSQFFPVVRSVVHLSLNLTLPPGPSYDQSFLMTTIHEMGHALGLQHTFTSASMSQATTRATTLSHPVSADDAAGISVLYPNANFAQFGSITGKITAGGKGVHLASVVAIQSGADAVSAVTNQDGSFRMDGVPAGQYAIYVHTMPPDADVYGPWNADGTVAAPSGAINSLFYPAAKTFTQATPVSVKAGTVSSGINITAVTRASVPLYDGQVYGYFNNYAIEITPAFVTISANSANAANATPVVASLVGLGSNEPATGLSVEMPGGAVSIASNGIVPFTASGFTYAALYLNFAATAQPGPQHIIFDTPDYIYVLPSAMYLTQNGPPTVTAVTSNGDGTLTVTGTNWATAALLYFDGLPATIVSLDPIGGSAVVVPPAGANGQQSTLTAYNPDGQNSQILQSADPASCQAQAVPPSPLGQSCAVTYSYGNLPTPAIASITPSSLPAGAEATIDITSTNFSFTPGLTTIGFGTTDITVQRIFVLSPNHAQVNVSVSATAALSTSDVSAIFGFQIATAPAAFQITPQITGFPTPNPSLINASAGLTGSYAGAVVSLYGTNLAVPDAMPSITIGGQAAAIFYASPTQINLQIPAGLPSGPAIMTLINGVRIAYPITVNIDPPPAAITAIQDSTGAYISGANPARDGEVLIITLTNFAQAGVNINPNRVQASVGGVNHNASQVTETMAGSVNYSQVTFQLNANDPPGPSEPLIVYLDGFSSYPAWISLANPDGTFTSPPASTSTH